MFWQPLAPSPNANLPVDGPLRWCADGAPTVRSCHIANGADGLTCQNYELEIE